MYVGEDALSALLVDHLYDSDDDPPDADGHAQDRLGHIPRLKRVKRTLKEQCPKTDWFFWHI
jgi:hypothetical protein